MTERNKIISRLKKLITNNKDFYERHPDLLQQVENKIKLLEKGYDYKIVNAGWVIPYTWGSSVGLQKIDKNGKILLRDVKKTENKITVDLAKEICQETYNNYNPLIPTNECSEQERKQIEELNREVYERIKFLNMK